jgi:hypothetical protein
MDLVQRILGRREVYDMQDVFCCEGLLNMTFLGFNRSHYINGVAKKHAADEAGLALVSAFSAFIVALFVEMYGFP